MELIDLVPNSLTFRVINTIDIEDESAVAAGYSGRVRRYLDGALVYVAWYRDGLLHNPGRSNPAYRRFRPDGKVKYELFYVRGELDDPADDGPAVRGYYADGKVHYQEHYRAGKRNDAADGTAAIRKWRHDGSLRHELHYTNGRRGAATIAMLRYGC
jgi:antitoxin component YwqK of YwqJK toxin-antitoxin module